MCIKYLYVHHCNVAFNFAIFDANLFFLQCTFKLFQLLVDTCGLKTFSVVFKDVPHGFMLILTRPLD